MCIAIGKNSKNLSGPMVFVIDINGRLLGFSTENKYMNVYEGKWINMCLARNFIWSIDGHGIVNVFVNHEDVSICIKEETFENERWMPIKGFGKHFLPTDRYQWSSADGTVERKIENIRLPSNAWKWEGDWRVEAELGSVSTETEGWTYALDFPNKYCANYFFPAAVRRRKWYRYRRYVGVRSWIKLNSYHDISGTEDLIQNVSAGGHNYFDGHKCESISLWAVTVSGKVLYRSDVSLIHPEGTDWINVPVPGEQIKSVSCGANKLLWALNYDGEVLIRSGITLDNPIGIEWLKVPLPKPGLQMNRISLGTNVVWALSSDRQLWFREGIPVGKVKSNDKCLVGSKWINVPGKMTAISAASDDSIWAISETDNKIYYRTSCYSTEWVQLNIDNHVSDDLNIDVEDHENKEYFITTLQSAMRNLQSKEKEHDDAVASDEKILINVIDAGSIVNSKDVEIGQKHLEQMLTKLGRSLQPRNVLDSEQNVPAEQHDKEILPSVTKLITCQYKFKNETEFKTCLAELNYVGEDKSKQKTGHLKIYTQERLEKHPVRILLSSVLCVMNETKADFISIALYFKRNDVDDKQWALRLRFYFENELEDWFSTLNSVCCSLNGHNQMSVPSNGSLWLTTRSEGSIYVCEPSKYPLRLKGRYLKVFEAEESMPQKFTLCNGFPLHTSITIHGHIPNGAIRCSFNLVDSATGNNVFHLNPRFDENVIVMNDRVGNKWGREERMNLSLTPSKPFIIDVCCLSDNFEVSINSTVCYNFRFRSLKDCITSLNIDGDVRVRVIWYRTIEELQSGHDKFWRKINGKLSKVKSANGHVIWGLSEDKQLWTVGSSATGQINDSKKGAYCETDHLYENQKWVRNDFASNSSSSTWTSLEGLGCSMNNDLPNDQWKWVTNWEVDRNFPHSTDEMGWQYTCEPNASQFNAKRRPSDNVRRRLWYRTRQFCTESSWKRVDDLKFEDFAFSVIDQDLISTWTITVGGKILFRNGVSKINPTGHTWESVPINDIPVSVNLGSYSQVYVCTENIIYYRVGITKENLIGTKWEGCTQSHPIIKVAVTDLSLWGLKQNGEIFTSAIPTVPASKHRHIKWNPLKDNNGTKFTDITAKGNHVWAVDDKGNLFSRIVISSSNIQGNYWLSGIMNDCNAIGF